MVSQPLPDPEALPVAALPPAQLTQCFVKAVSSTEDVMCYEARCRDVSADWAFAVKTSVCIHPYQS